MKLFVPLCLLLAAFPVQAADPSLHPLEPSIPPASPVAEAPLHRNGAFPIQAGTVRRPSSLSIQKTPRAQSRIADSQTANSPKPPAAAKALADYPQDLQNIVRACGGDPLKLFDLVHNEVRFQPYRGFRKGPVLTWQTKAGSDADQAQLLVELLHAAGCEAFYYYGVTVLPATNAFAWWGVDNLAAMDAMTGSAGYSAGHTADGGYAVEQIWVVVNIAGTYYHWAPAYKMMTETAGIDVAAASGYSRSALLTAAGGVETATAVQGVSETAVTAYLADRATALRAEIRTAHPNASVGEIVGERQIQRTTLTMPLDGFPGEMGVLDASDNFAFDEPYATYESATGPDYPHYFSADLSLLVGPSNANGTDLASYLVRYDGPISAIAGHQVAVGLSDTGRAQILIDDVVVSEAPTAYVGAIGLKYYIDHPYADGAASLYDLARFKPISPGGRYVINVGTGGEDRGELRQRARAHLDALVQAGIPAEAPSRIDTSLRLLGLDWLSQSALGANLLGQAQRVNQIMHHTVAIAAQEAGFFVDIPVTAVSIARDGRMETTASFRKSYVLLGSAMEHGVIEGTHPGRRAVSTVRFLRENNLAGGKTFYATAASYAAIAADPAFVAGWTVSWRDTYFPNAIANGATLVIPQDGAIQLDSLTGNGYFQFTPNEVTAAIQTGALDGGYVTTPGNADGMLDLTPWLPKPGFPEVTTADPIDLFNGTCVADRTDLTLGGDGARGLTLSRHYSSATAAGPSQLGRGWSHNFEGYLAEHSDTVAAFGGTTPESAANAIVATLVLSDLSTDALDRAKGWVVASIAAYWTLEQTRNNTVSATFGRQRFSFTRQADGTFTPAAGITAQLVHDPDTGLYTIAERFGQRLEFDGLNRLTAFTDADGNTLSLGYADTGRLETATDWIGRTLTFAYYSDPARDGLLASVTDSTGRTVGYDYTGGQLTSVTDPENNTRRFEYDANGRLWKTFDEQNRIVAETLYDAHGTVRTQIAEGDAAQTWQYAFTGALNTETNPLGETTAYRYDEKGRLVAQTDGEGHTATRAYDGQNHLVAAADALGHTTRFQYDDRHNLRFVTDARNATTEHRYDEFGRLRFTIDPLGKTTEFRYDEEHHLVKTIDPLRRETTIEYHTSGQADGLPWQAHAPNGDTTTTYYDAYGNPATIIRADGSQIDSTYNDRGDLLESATTTVGDPNVHAVSFTYDDNRRLLTSSDALGFGTTNTFDPAGNLEAVEDRFGNVASFTWSSWGRKLTAIGPNRATTRLGYDGAGRSSTVTDALAQTTRFGYDRAGRLTTTTDPLNQVVTCTYDAAGRNDSLTNARGKTWLFGFTATGRLETLTTPLNRLTDTDYNELGLPLTVTEPSLQATTYSYFEDARLRATTDAVGTITYGYDANGRLETVAEAGKTITRHYNALGQLDRFTDGAGNAIAYKYDGAGNLTELTYPGTPPRKVSYTYDTADRLATVTDWAARVTRFRYDAQSRLWKIELPNGTQRVFTYDSAGRVASVRDEIAAGGALVSQFTLGYDALDRIVEETTLPEPTQFAVTAASMSYDDDDRLAGWNNLVTQSDADGNLTKGPLGGVLTTFNYDARNRLASVGNTGYTYDAENRRISRAAPGSTTTFVHDPNAALSRLLQSTTGSTTTRYVYAGSLLLYAETGTSIRVHHYDYRGSTVALTDTTGAVLGRVTYGSYGEIVARSGDTATEFLYNGRDGVVTDPNGLYHMRARYYSPETRRFLNADPIGFAAGTNWYAYVGGSPVMSVDPRGLDWIDNTANFIVGMGDSLSFGITRAIRDNISFYDGTVDYDSKSYFAGEVVETGIEIGLTLGAAALKKGAARAAAELGEAGMKAVRREAREVAEVAVRQTSESGERLFVHHSNPLLGHPGGAPTLFPTLGLDGFRNSKLNLAVLNHIEHVGAHRLLRFEEKLFGGLVMNPALTGFRAFRNTGLFWYDSQGEGCAQ